MIGWRKSKPFGYIILRKRDRLRGLIPEHVVIAERILGKPLPEGAVVHHHNKNPSDNRPANLVICPDTKYHSWLHQRMDAKEACGNPNWLKCYVCKKYDAPENIVNYAYKNTNNRGTYVHKECHKLRQRSYRAKSKKDCRPLQQEL